jgi:hypothetical protein
MRIGGVDAPSFEKSDEVSPFKSFKSKHYLAFPKNAENEARKIFENASFIDSDECALVTEELCESDLERKLSNLSVSALSHIRLL